ncbi:phage head-tail joining protein [Thiohalocapsa marina]|uniref:phage head-tail joining protein n=1 Tax=Thiohalocapsa marina TaxID=424902 RepID=UPI0036DC01F2
MAINQADLDRLDAAIAAAELEVEIDGRRVRYRSVSELIAARAHLAAVASSAGTPRARSAYRWNMTTSRGE